MIETKLCGCHINGVYKCEYHWQQTIAHAIEKIKPNADGDFYERTAAFYENGYAILNKDINERLAKAESLFQGEKADANKPRFSLIPLKPLHSVVDVLEYGAKKYAPDNWQKVPDSRTRYFDACQRHILAWWGGEKLDPESGLPHLAHAVCCLLFLMWGDDENQNK